MESKCATHPSGCHVDIWFIPIGLFLEEQRCPTPCHGAGDVLRLLYSLSHLGWNDSMCVLPEYSLVILLKIDCDISIIILSPNAVIVFVMLREVSSF